MEMASSGSELFTELATRFGATAVDDPYDFYAQRRRGEPVVAADLMVEFGLPSFISGGGTRPVFTVYRYVDVAAGLRDHETFSSSLWLDLLGPITGRTILGLDGDEHRHWRGLLLPVFTRAAVQAWETRVIRQAADAGVARIKAQGGRADLVEFAQRFPLQVVYEIIGLPAGEELYTEFERMALTMLLAFAPEPDSAEPGAQERIFLDAITASGEIYEMIKPIVVATRARGADGDDLISQLIRSEFEGRRLDDDAVTTFIRSLLPAATDNTTRQLLISATLLLERPAVLDEIRHDRSLLPSALIETERFDGPVAALSRITTREVEIAGVTIPAGAGVSFAINSANRDGDVFPDPDLLDIRRRGERPLVWGLGRHVCPAMNTGRAEIRVGLEALLDELPYLRLDRDAEPPEIRGLHTRSPATLNVAWG
jgi:cytochrome P450